MLNKGQTVSDKKSTDDYILRILDSFSNSLIDLEGFAKLTPTRLIKQQLAEYYMRIVDLLRLASEHVSKSCMGMLTLYCPIYLTFSLTLVAKLFRAMFPKAVDAFNTCLNDISDIHDRLLTLLKAAHTAISRDSLDLVKMNLTLTQDLHERKHHFTIYFWHYMTSVRDATNSSFGSTEFN